MNQEIIDRNNIIKIIFCIKIKEEIQQSFPNKYESCLIDTTPSLIKIAQLQMNFAEIFGDKEHCILYRMSGMFDGYEICFVTSFDEVRNKKNSLKILFSEITPNDEELDDRTILVLTGTSESDKHHHIKNFTPELLKYKAIALFNNYTEKEKKLLKEFENHYSYEKKYSELLDETEVSEGFFNSINISTLESLRIKTRKKASTHEFIDDDIHKLVNLFSFIKKHIYSRLGKNLNPNIQSAAMYFTDVSSNFDFSQPTLNRTTILKRYPNYDPTLLLEAIKFTKNGNFTQDVTENELINEIKKERLLIDSLITINSASNVSPVIKLNLSNNQALVNLFTLAKADRANSNKTNNSMKRVREDFSKNIGRWLKYFEDCASVPIKIISNLPLEWSSHQGLPLMIRHEVSRIPVTPGYVTSKLLLDSQVIHLTEKAFEEILFISSFEENDPIRHHLKDKIKTLENTLNKSNLPIEQLIKKHKTKIPKGFIPKDKKSLNIKFKWIEVSNSEELINAVNNNPVAITIFDLHGSHDLSSGGKIELRNEIVCANDLIGKIRISPIVILSSCDTSPVDKGDQSTAESFFINGAKTVISSALPINSDLASTFLMRLMIRIRDYLPNAIENMESIKWSTLVSGMTRRTYYSELLSSLQRKYAFTDTLKIDLLFDIGMNLDPLNINWVKNINQLITKNLNISNQDLDEFIENNFQFFECLKYLQMGIPEKIIISSDSM